MGRYEFHGDPAELSAAYDRLMSAVPPDGLYFHACVTVEGGLHVYDACPSAAAFEAFSTSNEFLGAVAAAGLPQPVVTPLGSVHVARVHDTFLA